MMALALVMGMSQCKKNEQTANSNNGEKPIITVSVPNGSADGSKLYFSNEISGKVPVFWQTNDVVYVSVGGKCIGYLIVEGESPNYPATGNSFANLAGYVETFHPELLQENDVMELYVLGGITQTIIEGDVDHVTVSYANQNDQPTVIARGVVDEPYSVNTTHYMCEKFTNMNALVKFTVEGANTDAPITICGVKNQSEFYFDGRIVNSDEEGNIATFRGINQWQNGHNNIRYAVVPSNQRATSGDIIATGYTGTYEIYEGAAGTNAVMRGKITLTPAK